MMTNPWFWGPIVGAIVFSALRASEAIKSFSPTGSLNKDAFSEVPQGFFTVSFGATLLSAGAFAQNDKFYSIPENVIATISALGIFTGISSVAAFLISPGKVGRYQLPNNEGYRFSSLYYPIVLSVFGALRGTAAITIFVFIFSIVLSIDSDWDRRKTAPESLDSKTQETVPTTHNLETTKKGENNDSQSTPDEATNSK